MDWQEIFNSVMSDIMVAAVVGVATGILAFFRGKKKGESISVRAVERKKEIYLPLLEELEKQAYGEWGIVEEISTPLFDDCVSNNYKYALDDELQEAMKKLFEMHERFNKINVLRIAHRINVDIFEYGYLALYGTMVECTIPIETPDGDDYYADIIVPPIECMMRMYDEEAYKRLLKQEGEPDQIVIIQIGNSDEDEYDYVYSELVNLYASALYVFENGVQNVLPKTVIDINMLPEEYIAYKYNFFDQFNKEAEIIEKNELKEEITLLSQWIVQQIKERIEKIVKTYEVEQI